MERSALVVVTMRKPQAELGMTVYVIFLVWDVFEVVVIYFFLVETKGLTLEEINEIFEEKNPRSYSDEIQKQRKAARVADAAALAVATA